MVIVCCIGLSLIAIAGASLLLAPQTEAQPPATPETAPGTQALPPTAAPQQTEPPDAAALPPEVQAEMDLIQQQVAAIRQLQPKQAVDRALLSRQELQERILTDFLRDFTPAEAQNEQQVLRLLGLLPNGTDLYGLYQSLYSEQVAGYYNSEEEQMVVVEEGGFGGTERMTYAHEFVHALQDQIYDLENGLRLTVNDCKQAEERCTALQALLEGDATYLQQSWLFRHASEQDQNELQEALQDMASPVFDSAPAYLREDFTFPYLKGLEFVASLFDQGGWQAVNDAYADPPVSSEQILHPERYPEDRPVAVSLPAFEGLLGPGWKELDRNVLGEWYTYLVLAHGADEEARLPGGDARRAAAGWGGDAYAAYADVSGQSAVLVLRTAWDSLRDAEEFWQALQRYGIARWGAPTHQDGDRLEWQNAPEGAVSLRRSGLETLWLTASDPQTAALVLGGLPGFSGP